MCIFMVKKYTEKYTKLEILLLNCLVLFSGQHAHGKNRIEDYAEDPN